MFLLLTVACKHLDRCTVATHRSLGVHGRDAGVPAVLTIVEIPVEGLEMLINCLDTLFDKENTVAHVFLRLLVTDLLRQLLKVSLQVVEESIVLIKLEQVVDMELKVAVLLSWHFLLLLRVFFQGSV